MGWGSAPRPGRLYPQERPGTHCTGGRVGHRAVLDRCGKSRPYRNFFFKLCLYWYLYVTETTGVLMFPTGLFVATLHNVTASCDESLKEWEMLLSKMYGVILSHFSLVLNGSGADGERVEIIAHPGIFVLWVSWVLVDILSSWLVARSPSSRLTRGVATSGDGLLLDELRSILSPPVFWGASDGRSGVGSIPLVCVWGVCVLLPLSWFLSKFIPLVLPRRQLVDAVVYLLSRTVRRTLLW